MIKLAFRLLLILLPLGGMTEYQVTSLGVDGLTVSFRLALQ